jgi:hypothetical protein
MRRAIHIAAIAVSTGLTFALGARADDGAKDCIQKITIMENIFDAEKIKFSNDKCALLKAARATRRAMLDEIAKHPDQCGLKKQFIDMLRSQQSSFGSQVAAVCR